MKSPQFPTAPDPNAVAQTQLGYNTQAARVGQQLSMVNQSGPGGSLTYNQTGRYDDGTPQYTATTSLSPGAQGLYDTNMGTAQTLSSRIQQGAGNPFSLQNSAVEGRLIDLGNQRLSPMLAQQRTAREADLLNRGLTMGSEAYNNAMTQVGQQENDARNQLILTGHQQAVSDITAEHNQPYEDLQRVLGGVPSSPQFQSTPGANVAAPDYAGAAQQQYQSQLQQYQQQIAQQNAALGGMFGVGGTLLGGWARNGLGMPRF
jgi:hypothetical protein